MLKDTAHKSSCQSKKASIHARPPALCLSTDSCSFPGDTVGFYLTHWSASTGSLAEPLWLSFSKSLFYSLWWIPNVLRTSANYQYFSLDCSLVSKTDCSLVNHQNNKNNVLAQNNPSKCFEGCGKHSCISTPQIAPQEKEKQHTNKDCWSRDRNRDRNDWAG